MGAFGKVSLDHLDTLVFKQSAHAEDGLHTQLPSISEFLRFSVYLGFIYNMITSPVPDPSHVHGSFQNVLDCQMTLQAINDNGFCFGTVAS